MRLTTDHMIRCPSKMQHQLTPPILICSTLYLYTPNAPHIQPIRERKQLYPTLLNNRYRRLSYDQTLFRTFLLNLSLAGHML